MKTIKVNNKQYEICSIISSKNHIITYSQDIYNFIIGYMSLYKVHSYKSLSDNKIHLIEGGGKRLIDLIDELKAKDITVRYEKVFSNIERPNETKEYDTNIGLVKFDLKTNSFYKDKNNVDFAIKYWFKTNTI